MSSGSGIKTSELLGYLGEEGNDALRAYRASITKAATDQEGYKPSLGLNPVNLEAPAKVLQAFVAPFSKRMPRPQMNPPSNKANWKVLKDIRPAGLVSVSTEDGAKGPNIKKTSEDRDVFIKRIAVTDFIVDDAMVFSEKYEDLRATADFLSLNILLEAEDRMDIGGNGTTALAVPAAGSAVLNGSGGFISAGAIPVATSVVVTALTMQGLFRARRAGYLGHVLADGLENGESAVSASFGTVGPSVASDSLTITIPYVPDAVGYNVYLGPVGSEVYAYTIERRVSTITTDPAVGGLAKPVADTSLDPNAWDGVIQQLRLAGAPQTSLGGSPLTATAGTKSIIEFVDQMQKAFASGKAGCDEIWVGTEIGRSIPELIGGSSATVVLNESGKDLEFRAGFTTSNHYNQFTHEGVPIVVHPDWPAGVVAGIRWRNPYAHDRLGGAAVDKLVAKAYWSQTFAKNDFTETFGVSEMATLRVRSSIGSWVLTDVGV